MPGVLKSGHTPLSNVLGGLWLSKYTQHKESEDKSKALHGNDETGHMALFHDPD